MSVSQIENHNEYTNLDPLRLYFQVNQAYEEFKDTYQSYDPSMQEIYDRVYVQLGEIYQRIVHARGQGDPNFRLTQEIAQFLLELELSAYYRPSNHKS